MSLNKAPETMGQGHTVAEDKISNALHMSSMEVFDCEHLLKYSVLGCRYLHVVQSFTSDMGTEVNITEFHHDRGRFGLIMPTWFSMRIACAPAQPEAVDDPERN